MYKHILIATDGSELSGQAIEHGVALAKSVGAGVSVLTVSEPFYPSAFEPKMVEQYKQHVATLATKHLDLAKNAADAFGKAEPEHRSGVAVVRAGDHAFPEAI